MNTSRYDALDEVNKLYYEYKQEVGETNAKHLRNLKIIVSAVEHIGGTMFSDENLIKIERKKDEDAGKTSQDDDHYKAVVRGKMLRVAFLKRSSCAQTMTSIRDQNSFKTDVYPQKLYNSYELIENHSLSTVK